MSWNLQAVTVTFNIFVFSKLGLGSPSAWQTKYAVGSKHACLLIATVIKKLLLFLGHLVWQLKLN